MFAFIVTPLDNRYRSFIAHLHFDTKGSFNDSMLNIIIMIETSLRKKGFIIYNRSFDGD